MSDVQGLLTEHLDIWTNAESGKKSGRGRSSGNGETVYGVKKLRELILELAVRGKLVPQDPKDEPASELLKRIQAEKAKRSKGGKAIDLSPTIDDAEKPFLEPFGWEWRNLGALCLLENGDRSKNYPNKNMLVNNGIPFVNAGHLIGNRICREEMTFISEDHYDLLRSGKFQDGDILYCLRGSLGKTALVEGFHKGAIASSLVIVRLISELNPRYFLYYFSSPLAQSAIKQYDNGTAQPNLSAGDLAKFLVPIPPLPEQNRIVAKVDELMALCDQLEAQHNNAADAHEKLVTHLLGTLTQSQDAADFNANWQRIAEHFDTLFTTEHSIDTLKQTLLQLAVMGKLVPQDPNDEPASELLKRIIEKKQELIKRGIYKNKKAVKPQRDDIMLPSSWEKICVQDFADVRLGATPSRTNPGYWGGDIPWVSSGEVANNIIYETNEKITLAGFQSSSVTMIPARSLLIAIIGQGKTRGQSAILGIDACTNQNVAALVFDERTVSTEYVWIWAKSKYESHRGDGRGGAQPALNGEIVRSFTFHLPPIAEQQRIVKKTNELMTLCDHLKSRITDATQLKQKIADALVEQALH